MQALPRESAQSFDRARADRFQAFFPSLAQHHPRMTPRHCVLSWILTLAILCPASRALACACCSDPGTRVESVVKVTEFHRNQLLGMEFAPDAELFLTEAGEDSVKGIAVIAEKYQLTVKQDEKQWRFTFRADDGKTGTLTMPIPAKVGTFVVDPRDGRKSAGGGPLLYKEWRWEGEPIADGIFHKNARRFSLVFQGHGNRCDGGDDFSHWRLEVTGKDVRFALMGTFVRPSDEPAK